MTTTSTNSPNNDDFADLEDHIRSANWSYARRELYGVLSQGLLDVADYDLWGRFAGEIDRGLTDNWQARERFWRALSRLIHKKEKETKTQTHKGLIYFKIGVMSLLSGKDIQTGIKWLKLAYKEDEILFDERHEPGKLPNDQSAFRFMVILEAFRRFSNGIRNKDQRRQVQYLINLHRTRVARLFAWIFDKSIAEKSSGTPADLRGLNWAPFDKLIGRNPFRVVV